MRNVFRVLFRDLKRIAKAPASWVVVLFLVVLPSLYTWFNVIGFWDPYGNTGELRVCVVNEDAGANDETLGDLQLGDQIVEQLEQNDQLDWDITDRDTAMDLLESGKAYAVFVVPENFSSDMTTILTDSFQQPKLEYYVNEKLGPVSPKITDTGASTLDSTINETFISTVTSTVAQTLNDSLAESQARFDSSKSTVVTELDKVLADLDAARSAISQLDQASTDGIAKTHEAKSALDQAKSQISDMSLALSQLSTLTATVNTEMNKTVSSLSTALDKGSAMISSAAAQANTVIGDSAANIVSAEASVKQAAEYSKALVESNQALITELRSMQEDMPEGDQKKLLGDVIDTLETANNNASTQVGIIEQTATDVSNSAQSVASASNAINDSVQTTIKATDDYRTVLSTQTVPQTSVALATISATSNSLAGTVAQQTALVDQTASVLNQLEGTLSTTSGALAQTDALLADAQTEIDNVRTDVVALSTSGKLGELFGDDGSIDVDKVADFMQSPTKVKTEELYPLNAYGSAMAPLFINLTLWIGVFMLMVIMHVEVDDEGIKNLTIAQRYLGRGLLFAIMVSLQAIVCITGCLYLGVQTVSAPALYVTAIACSLTYLAIQYTLSTTLQHVGKGLCVIMVFVQIPGATGLYPVELTTRFFQTIYPVFPFTYGINAMRETVSGFYGNAWTNDLAMLALFFIVFVLIGVFVRPFLTNTNLMFAKQLTETDIINHETVHLPERRYRVTQIIRAMSDHGEFRAYLDEHSARFFRLYPRLKRDAIIFGIGVPVVFTTAMAFLSPGKKVVVLTVWLLWLVVVIAFLLVIEHVRDSLERQAALNAMSDAELRELFSARNRISEKEGAHPAAAASVEGGEGR